MRNELEDFIQNNREAFDYKMPDPEILNRIQEQMGGTHKKKGILISFKTLRTAAACLVLLAGLGVYFLNPKTPIKTKIIASQPLIPVNKYDSSSFTKEPQKQDLAFAKNESENRLAVNFETESNKQVIFSKLSDMGSASSRVMATYQAGNLEVFDKEIVDALVNTLNTDPNSNVRLSALEALTKFHTEKYVKKQLINTLSKQTDPMVQIQLIQLLTKMREKTIISELEKMAEDVNTIDAVKDKAYSGILSLQSFNKITQ